MDIRFRVWDGTKMWYPEGRPEKWFIGLDGSVLEEKGDREDGYYLIEDKACVAMLSMGFKDESGKELWEGDIVKVKDGVGLGYISEAVILGSLRGINVQVIVDKDIEDQWEKEKSEYECIGNKYENPELLKEVAPDEDTLVFRHS